jgi:hypothetical protein
MKKILIFGLSACALLIASCASDPLAGQPSSAPAVDKSGAIVIDVSALPTIPKDNIRLINLSSSSNFGVDVYYYDVKQKQWKIFGSALLKEKGDTSFVNSALDSVYKIRYFAIVPDSKVSVNENADVRHHDLYITLTDK